MQKNRLEFLKISGDFMRQPPPRGAGDARLSAEAAGP
jgi:hypothetical protein